MSGKLNWEAASRASRVSRSGSEPVYRGLASGESVGGGEVAVYAYEQAANRAAAKARKRTSKLATRQATIEDRRIRRKKAHEERLKQYIAEAAAAIRRQNPADPKLEGTIILIDSLINKLQAYDERTPVLIAAHTTIVNYMDALRATMTAIDDYQDDEIFDTRIRHAPYHIVIRRLWRKVRSCNVSNLAQLHAQIERSLKRFGKLSDRGKEYFAYALMAERVIVLTPSARVLYFSKYALAASN